MKTTALISSLALTTLTVVPFTFAPPAQASVFSRAAYGPNGAAGRTTAWGPNGAGECANARAYGGSYASGCSSVYHGENGSYWGQHSGSYNANTGNGYHEADRNATYNDNSYGYDTNTNYSYDKGNGVNSSTTVNTQNNGSYTCSLSTQSGCNQ